MRGFDPHIHTPAALYQEIIQVSETAPTALIVASLGRAAYYNAAVDDPTLEYSRKQYVPVKSFFGGPADIDVLNPIELDDNEFGPFKVDSRTLDGRQVSMKLEGGTWYLRSDNRGFSAALDPAVMRPVLSHTVYGADCYTVPGQTHLALLGLTGTLRPSDIEARQLLLETLQATNKEPLPAKLYEPFEELRELNIQSLFTKIRTAYRHLIPAQVRQPLAPLVQPVKDHFLH